MTLERMTELANTYTDESADEEIVAGFINTAISRINAELKTKLPIIDTTASVAEEYTPLEDTWVNLVLIPYACWGIKMNDGSLNEARMYEIQFLNGLELIKANKRIAIDTAFQREGFINSWRLKNYRGITNLSNNRATSIDPLGQGINLADQDGEDNNG